MVKRSIFSVKWRIKRDFPYVGKPGVRERQGETEHISVLRLEADRWWCATASSWLGAAWRQTESRRRRGAPAPVYVYISVRRGISVW